MISIVIPCFNEELIINDFIDELKNNIDQIKDEFEIIFVDNKSEDSTLDIINKKKQIFKNCKIICLSNYFGKESSILAGFDACNGDASIVMDPDLEDPPSLITELIKNWNDGNDVVYAQRKNTETTFIKKFMRNIFYFMFKNLVIKLAGPDVDESKASIPYFIRKNILDLDLPFFLKGLSNSMPFCFNPT